MNEIIKKNKTDKQNLNLIIAYNILLVFIMFYSLKEINKTLLSNTIVYWFFMLTIYYISILIKKELLKKIFLYTLSGISFILFYLNSLYINETLKIKYSLLNIRFDIFLFFIKNVLSITKISIIISSFLIFWILYIKIIKKINLKKIYSYIDLFFILIIIASIIIFIKSTESISNPYINTFEDIKDRMSNSNMNIKLSEKDIKNVNISYIITNTNFNNSLQPYSYYKLKKNQVVLVFVMEQIPLYRFLEDVKKIPKESNFFELVKNDTVFYDEYYTTNQDSRTAIWTMLSSQFIPFECYINNWNKKYGNVIYSRNLVDLFKYNNYTTIIIASQDRVGLILGAYDWNKKIYLKNYDEISKKFVCQKDLEYSKGCEDLSIINITINEILKHRKNLFLMQEMIYGHGPIFHKMLNKTSTEYYNNYFLKVYNALKKNELYNENLTIIIVSDHGDKDLSIKKELKQYKIPFMIISPRLKGDRVSRLSSHIDFKNILLEEIIDNPKNLSSRTHPIENIIIGQTMSNEVAYINENRKYFVGIKKKDNEYLISETNMNITEIISILKQFQKYQNYMISINENKNYYCKYCE